MSEENLEEVPQEMMEELEYIKRQVHGSSCTLGPFDILQEIVYEPNELSDFPAINTWYNTSKNEEVEIDREWAILKHVYPSEPQFKAKKLKYWIVESTKDTNDNVLYLTKRFGIFTLESVPPRYAYKFSTREEAEKYSTPQTKVIQVIDDAPEEVIEI